jgi:hypothetical protein
MSHAALANGANAEPRASIPAIGPIAFIDLRISVILVISFLRIPSTRLNVFCA